MKSHIPTGTLNPTPISISTFSPPIFLYSLNCVDLTTLFLQLLPNLLKLQLTYHIMLLLKFHLSLQQISQFHHHYSQFTNQTISRNLLLPTPGSTLSSLLSVIPYFCTLITLTFKTTSIHFGNLGISTVYILYKNTSLYS